MATPKYRKAGAKRLTVSSQTQNSGGSFGGGSEVSAGNTTPKPRRAASYRSGRASMSEDRYRTRLEGQEFRALQRAGFRNTRRNEVRRG